MLSYKILIGGRILGHSAIGLSPAVIDVDYIIVCINSASLTCGFDLT